MRSVDKQMALVGRAVVTPGPVRIAITEALGLMCAEEVSAARPMPVFTQAAIDGYAVRSVDVGGKPPLGQGPEAQPVDPATVSLPVVGQVAAGSREPLRLQPKQAVRVATGAPLPTMADAVLPLEWSDKGADRVTPLRPVKTGEFIRRIGDDIQPGDVAVSPGSVLGAAQIGLLAAVGKSKVLVYPKPRVSIVSVGRELIDIDRTPGLGQVLDVNSYSLAAAAKEAGAEVHRVGIADGEPRKLKETLEAQAMTSEIIVISGAVGGSGSTEIQGVLKQLGDIDTTRVAMHPGSVQGIGLIGTERVPVFLLPSNPVSCLVIFEVFVRPMIRMALGKRNVTRRCVRARTLTPVTSRPGRRGYLRARLMRDADTQDYLVESLGGVSGAPAHLLAGMGEANALIRIPEDVTSVRPGDIVDVLFANQSG
ncbi:gephyrin-like molybdotransferase Glp [Corynebacterium mendelii]|uniref:Molybdopterin molybdenumtransferase n=1 Tax=Corynebacterium mendelii TaxID=2765362 RepID=A0A939IUA1_9CORY|nr:gephyrin-like molybdotransferase Glp [Corynebacterium mendelii]MBN9644719.1 molybdopterin molybdotransferase MoeA [Corynebacterium mendelii]